MEKRIKIHEVFNHPWVLNFEKEYDLKTKTEKKTNSGNNLPQKHNNPWQSAGAGFYKAKKDFMDKESSDIINNEEGLPPRSPTRNASKPNCDNLVSEILKKQKLGQSPSKGLLPTADSRKQSLGGQIVSDLLEISKFIYNYKIKMMTDFLKRLKTQML